MTLRNTPQTLGYEPLDSLHILACERVPVKQILHILMPKIKWIQQQQANTEIAECCRDPVENADIEAWYSCPEDAAKGVPDIYKFYCNACERVHVKFCVGGSHPLATPQNIHTHPQYHDRRPKWEIR